MTSERGVLPCQCCFDLVILLVHLPLRMADYFIRRALVCDCVYCWFSGSMYRWDLRHCDGPDIPSDSVHGTACRVGLLLSHDDIA